MQARQAWECHLLMIHHQQGRSDKAGEHAFLTHTLSPEKIRERFQAQNTQVRSFFLPILIKIKDMFYFMSFPKKIALQILEARLFAGLVSTITPKEQIKHRHQIACFPESIVLIWLHFRKIVNSRFYAWMGISVIALIAGFMILYS